MPRAARAFSRRSRFRAARDRPITRFSSALRALYWARYSLADMAEADLDMASGRAGTRGGNARLERRGKGRRCVRRAHANKVDEGNRVGVHPDVCVRDVSKYKDM
jgi:hypothetical protein